MNFYGSKPSGSTELQTSTAGAENLTVGVINFDFRNIQACHISVNGSEYIYIFLLGMAILQILLTL